MRSSSRLIATLAFVAYCFGCTRELPVVDGEPPSGGSLATSPRQSGLAGTSGGIDSNPAGASNNTAGQAATTVPAVTATSGNKCPTLQGLESGESSGPEPVYGRGTSTMIVTDDSTKQATTTHPVVSMCRALRTRDGALYTYLVSVGGATLWVGNPESNAEAPFAGDGVYSNVGWRGSYEWNGSVTVMNRGTQGVAELTDLDSGDHTHLEWTCDPAITVDPVVHQPVGIPPQGSAYLVRAPESNLGGDLVLWFDHFACDRLYNVYFQSPGSNEVDQNNKRYDLRIELSNLQDGPVPGETSARIEIEYFGLEWLMGRVSLDGFGDATLQCAETLQGTITGDDWSGAFNCPVLE